MNNAEFSAMMAKSYLLFSGLESRVKASVRPDDLLDRWRAILRSETLADVTAAVEAIAAGIIEQPKYPADWDRFPSIVAIHARQLRHRREDDQRRDERASDLRHQRRRKDQAATELANVPGAVEWLALARQLMFEQWDREGCGNTAAAVQEAAGRLGLTCGSLRHTADWTQKPHGFDRWKRKQRGDRGPVSVAGTEPPRELSDFELAAIRKVKRELQAEGKVTRQ